MAHSIDEHVGMRLRQLRKASGFSQGALAQKLDLTFQQIQKYEKGSNRVSASKLYQAASCLNVPIQAFFEGLPELGEESPDASRLSLVAIRSDLAKLVDAYERTDPRVRKKLLEMIEVLGCEPGPDEGL